MSREKIPSACDFLPGAFVAARVYGKPHKDIGRVMANPLFTSPVPVYFAVGNYNEARDLVISLGARKLQMISNFPDAFIESMRANNRSKASSKGFSITEQ